MSDVEETQLYPIWRELVKVAQTWEFGTFHSHKEISEILGVEPKSSRYYGYVQAARKMLILSGQIWECHTSKGYFIVEPNNHPEAAFEEVLKTRKHAGLYLMKSRYAPIERMDEQAKSKTEIAIIKGRGLFDMADKACFEMSRVLKPIPKKFQIKEAKPNTEEN